MWTLENVLFSNGDGPFYVFFNEWNGPFENGFGPLLVHVGDCEKTSWNIQLAWISWCFIWHIRSKLQDVARTNTGWKVIHSPKKETKFASKSLGCRFFIVFVSHSEASVFGSVAIKALRKTHGLWCWPLGCWGWTKMSSLWLLYVSTTATVGKKMSGSFQKLTCLSFTWSYVFVFDNVSSFYVQASYKLLLAVCSPAACCNQRCSCRGVLCRPTGASLFSLLVPWHFIWCSCVQRDIQRSKNTNIFWFGTDSTVSLITWYSTCN